MRKLKSTAVAMGAGLALTMASPAAQANTAPKHESAAYRLGHDPARLKALGTEVIARFKSEIAHGSVTMWFFAGVCAIMNEHLPATSRGAEVAAIVPNPGVLHIKDQKTGVTFTEAFAWDKDASRYVTGEIDLLGKNGSIYHVSPRNDQYAVHTSNSNLRIAKLKFSEQDDQIESVVGNVPIMDEVATGFGATSKSIAQSTNTQQACETTPGAAPPTTETQPTFT